MNIHQMNERLDCIIAEEVNDKPTPVKQAQMEALDRQMIELQKRTKQRCWKVLKP